jgi:serine/threonine protein phosphatase PrpC
MFDPAPIFIVEEATHVGLVRKLNEDSMLSRPALGVWVVADGMGGHSGGDFASQTIVEQIGLIDRKLPAAALMQTMRQSLFNSHELIKQEADMRDGQTIGSTAVLLILSQDHFVCLWAGDSRLYHCREGEVSQLSFDHTLVNEWVEEGKITAEEAESHPHGNVITRAVGVGDELEIDKIRGLYEPGDRFMLCSDGLTGYMDQAEMKDTLANAPMAGIAQRLVDGALAGGGRDNVTVIVVEVPY